MTHRTLHAVTLASAFGPACAAAAQPAATGAAPAYPTKSIRLIVGSSAGGGSDTFARVVKSDKRSENLARAVTGFA